jgi:hypothetical protein
MGFKHKPARTLGLFAFQAPVSAPAPGHLAAKPGRPFAVEPMGRWRAPHATTTPPPPHPRPGAVGRRPPGRQCRPPARLGRGRGALDRGRSKVAHVRTCPSLAKAATHTPGGVHQSPVQASFGGRGGGSIANATDDRCSLGLGRTRRSSMLHRQHHNTKQESSKHASLRCSFFFVSSPVPPSSPSPFGRPLAAHRHSSSHPRVVWVRQRAATTNRALAARPLPASCRCPTAARRRRVRPRISRETRRPECPSRALVVVRRRLRRAARPRFRK